MPEKTDKYLKDFILPISYDMPKDACSEICLAIRNQKPFGYHDLKNDPGFAKWRDYALEMGYGSNLAIPFIVDDKIEGGIMVYADRPFVFHQTLVDHLVTATLDVGYNFKRARGPGKSSKSSFKRPKKRPKPPTKQKVVFWPICRMKSVPR